MVRAHVKQSDEDKRETRKKKTPAKPKKITESGVWPCKIGGCNKQFAREADLKRHQRTTKSHSMPGFAGSACPQCDATFTRTDALRRHQKSRHNGVIIEPAEQPKNKDDGDEAGSSGSKVGSRSASPMVKGKGKGRGKKNAENPTALANPSTAGPANSGPSSYYRQHTMGNLQNGIMLDPRQYAESNLGLPTSATRLHQASWPPPPPWAAEGPQAQMGTISYHPGSQPGFYQPSPYYRQNGGPANGSAMQQQQFVHQPQDMQNNMSPHQNAPPTHENQVSRTGTPSNLNQPSADVEMTDGSSPQLPVGEGQSVPVAPVIDPSLDMSTPTGPPGNAQNVNVGGNSTPSQGASTKPVSLEITQAAMEAVLQSAQRESSRASGTPDRGISGNASPANGHTLAQTANIASQHLAGSPQGNQGLSAGSNTSAELKPPPVHTTGKSPFAHSGSSQSQPPPQPSPPQPSPAPQVAPPPPPPPQPEPVTRPEPMEPMLTEDGEPMLNPAELLTQESLASPPPS